MQYVLGVDQCADGFVPHVYTVRRKDLDTINQCADLVKRAVTVVNDSPRWLFETALRARKIPYSYKGSIFEVDVCS